MNIALLGYGAMGSALATRLLGAGHTVVVGVRTPAAAPGTVGDRLRVTDFASAVRSAEIVILAVPYAAVVDVLRAAGAGQGTLDHKIIIDLTNPLTSDYAGLTVGHTSSAAEEIARGVPRARVVKAFNTVFAQVMARGPEFGDARAPVFYAGDDTEANATVHSLIISLGFVPTPAGPLRNARYLEPLAGLNIFLGYGLGRGTQIVPHFLERAA
ncbi:MAG: NADPH-dependent F420 reductase [Sulfobacillus sp.]